MHFPKGWNLVEMKYYPRLMIIYLALGGRQADEQAKEQGRAENNACRHQGRLNSRAGLQATS